MPFFPLGNAFAERCSSEMPHFATDSAAAAWHWDDGLIADGEVVDACRRRVLELLQPDVQTASERLLGAEVELSYHSGWAEGSSLAEALAASRDRDLQMATSTIGPHRADFRITVHDRRARDTVSRGQEKLVAAALTLAQIELVARSREQTVVLLLDEPGADLDREHLARLLAAVADAPVAVLRHVSGSGRRDRCRKGHERFTWNMLRCGFCYNFRLFIRGLSWSIQSATTPVISRS